MSDSLVSVIIPTYNRKEPLQRLLDALSQQVNVLPGGGFEVIIVDDGGNDGSDDLVNKPYNFTLHYLRQVNQGATVARNYGSSKSKGEILVFMDDDIILREDALPMIVQEIGIRAKTIILGTLVIPDPIIQSSSFGKIYLHRFETGRKFSGAGDFVKPYECMTGLIALKREDFQKIGGFSDPTDGKGWPNWDDVDFGVRSSRQGYTLWRSTHIIGYHYDYAAKDMDAHKERMYRAGRSAVLLLKRYPDLENAVPLFRDRSYIAWGKDSPSIALRKLWRSFMSWSIIMAMMRRTIKFLEEKLVLPVVLLRLYIWYISSSVTKGLRHGVREFGTW